MTVSETITVSSTKKHFKKPDEAAQTIRLEELNKKLDTLKKQQDTVKAKIEKLGKSDNTRREELKGELDQIRDKQSEIKQGKKSVYDQLDALNDSIKKKVGNVKNFQTKVPFKSTAEVDERIRELEIQIERGVRLVEEKKILQEISTLKRGRLQVEGLGEQQEAIERERTFYNELRKNVDDGENKRLSDKYELLNAELRTLIVDGAKQREERNKLYDERTRIKLGLDETYDTLRACRSEHRKAKDAYYNAAREAHEKRKETERVEKIKYEAEKREADARQELELASLPAFEREIVLCDTLSAFLQGFISKSGQDAAGNPATSVTADDANSKNAPQGFVIKKKEEDEVYFMGGGKNNKKKGGGNPKAPKEKKSDILKLPLATMEDFFDVKVTVPTKISEVPATIEKLKERKLAYVDEQPKVTEENRKKAEEKIASMVTEEKVAATAAEETPAVETTVIAA
ncbi:hypothetical protein HPULCUR_004014 [Helicostylum pulchrum]|uniref:Uncharacterized protein n=1 Tax=Helicostylum pulchrum TaxID=562976 RepID=A0ABP9XV08_9FUNG